MEPNVRSVRSKQALAVYAESLAGTGRVAVFGDVSSGVGTRLAQLGASSVEVWDPDAARARAEALHAAGGITVQVYSSARGVPARAIDLAIVPDLGLFDDAPDLIARVREMVGAGGVAIIAAANRDGPPIGDARPFDYYELFELAAAEFSDVRMVAEVPFHGVALVRLGDDDEPQAVSVDTQLADANRQADTFVVVASQRPIVLDPYTIIELAVAPAAVLSGEVEAARATLLQALQLSRAHQQEARDEAETLRAELRARAGAAERTAERLVELEGLLRDQFTRATELEGALVERARHLSDLSAAVEEMRVAAEAGRVAAADLERIARRAESAERRRAELEHELATVAEAHAGELVRFEEGLRDRARAVKTLEVELVRREKMVRELASAIDEAAASVEPVALGPPVQGASAVNASLGDAGLSNENARLREQLNGLALDLARREGEAQAAEWTVAELEGRLAQTATAAEPQVGVARAALDELDALRRALAQEHEERRKAEAGAGVARAEVARQAGLLEQLGRQLDAQRRDVGEADDRTAGPPTS